MIFVISQLSLFSNTLNSLDTCIDTIYMFVYMHIIHKVSIYMIHACRGVCYLTAPQRSVYLLKTVIVVFEVVDILI